MGECAGTGRLLLEIESVAVHACRAGSASASPAAAVSLEMALVFIRRRVEGNLLAGHRKSASSGCLPGR